MERKTVHISDDSGRIAMYEYRTLGWDNSPQELMRYIYSNNLSSSMLELDDTGNIISYEEYHPFGTTAYQATNASINAVAKRYRYTGKERDEESGLYYHGARYYMPWLCRWTQCDPIGIKDGLNVYAYCSNNPVMLHDPSGTSGNGGETYKVKKGDTLGEIAKANNTTVAKLQELNPDIKDANKIQAGQKINLGNNYQWSKGSSNTSNMALMPLNPEQVSEYEDFQKRPLKTLSDGYGSPELHSYTLVVKTTKENFEKLKEAYSTDPGIVQDNPNADYRPLENPKDADNILQVGDGMDIKIGFNFGKPFSGQVKFTNVDFKENSFSISASVVGKEALYKNHPDAGNINFSASFDPKSSQMTFNITNNTTLGNFLNVLGQATTGLPRDIQEKQWKTVIGNVANFMNAKPADIISKIHISKTTVAGYQPMTVSPTTGIPIGNFKTTSKTIIQKESF